MSRNDLRPGQTIAHYRIIDKVGEGGMASVYKAMDLKLARTVALKLIELDEELDEETRMRFIREARLAAQLNHPGITTIYEINEDPGKGLGFISMEFIEGWTLKQILAEEGPLELRRFFEVSKAICEAIAEAHRHGIVHRDLKLPNIMQTTRGDIKVMDFGIAKTFGEDETWAQENITARGMTLGTVEYMSPEQIMGETLDGRSDVFSAAVLFFELLTGVLPFEGKTQVQTFRAILNSPPRKLLDVKPDLPEPLAAILETALHKDRLQRYQTIESFAKELDALHDELFAPPPVKGVPLRLAVGVAALLVAAGLFVGWQLFGRRSLPPGLAVLYFQNETDPQDPERVGRMATNLLITSLSTDGSLDVVSSQKLYDVLKQFGKNDMAVITPDEARKVARAANASKMVVGSIFKVENRIKVTSQLVDVESGNVIDSQQAEGQGNLSVVFDLVDKMALEIRSKLKLAKPDASKKLSEATSASAEAYREYVVGLDLLNHFNLPDAKAAFDRAIALDPDFLLAYYRLAMTQTSWVQDETVVKKVIEKLKIKANLEKLSVRDREMVEAFIAFLEKDYPRSVELYKALEEKYPDEKEVLYWLGNAYLGDDYKRCADALPYHERVMLIDRDYLTVYGPLLRCYDQTGKLDEALIFGRKFLAGHEGDARSQTLMGDIHQLRREMAAAMFRYHKALEIDPKFLDALTNMASAYVLQERYDEARAVYEQILDLLPPGAATSYLTLQNLGYALLQQGHFQEARGAFERKRALGEQVHDTRILTTSYEDKSISYFLEGKWDDAFAELENAYRYWKDGGAAYSRDYRALLLMKRNQLEAARLELPKFGKGDYDQNYAKNLQGWISLEEGKAKEALELFQVSQIPSRNHFYPVKRWAMGEAYLAMGKLPEAREEFSGIIRDNLLVVPVGSTLIVNRFGTLVYPLAYYKLGVIAEQEGDVALAANCYTRFLQLWLHAPDEVPEKQDAKRRLDALRASL